MAIVNFPGAAQPAFSLEELPDLDAMTSAELGAYLTALETELARLNADEPKRRGSEAHEAWEDAHEELEDLIDEVTDRIDELGN